MSRKGKEPVDSALNENPRSQVLNNWGAGSSRGVRQKNITAIAENIHKNPYVEDIRLLEAFTIAKMVEKGFYKEATNEHDYLTRVSDYIQRIPDTPENLKGALVDLASQMEQLDNSQVENSLKLLSDDNTVDAEDLPEEHLKEIFNLHLWQLLLVASRIKAPVRAQLLNSVAKPLAWLLPGGKIKLPPQHKPQKQQPLAGRFSGGITIRPPQHKLLQKQPPAEPLSDSNTTLPQLQLQQHQSGPTGGSD